jgi:hypothetical protein
MCTAAYREALTREFVSRTSSGPGLGPGSALASVPAPAPAPGLGLGLVPVLVPVPARPEETSPALSAASKSVKNASSNEQNVFYSE